MLNIYYKDSEGDYILVSTDSSITSPVKTSHDGKNGTTALKLLYLRNNKSTNYYTDITISPLDLVDPTPYGDLSYTETGWGVKLSKGGTELSEAEWDNIEWGEGIDMDDVGSSSLGDTTTYYPFWFLVSSPPNTTAQIKTDIAL